MYSEPVRREALQRARDLNRAAMTGKVKLLQETDKNIQAGFLMYLPVYKHNLPSNTLAERRSNITGWVYEPFRMDDFMTGLSVSLLSGIHVEIYDDKNLRKSAKMFDSDKTSNSCNVIKPKMQRIEQLDMNGQTWTMLFCSTPKLEVISDNQKPQIIAITGVFLCLLLTLITWQLLTSRCRALSLATQMTRELSESEARFRMMADSAPVLIWIAGVDKQRFWFNKTWLDFTGKNMQQERGNGWIAGIHPEDLQSYLNYYRSHFEQQQAFTTEYRLKRYDGEYRWILSSGVPRFDREGHFSGFIGSCVDITERKQTEAALLRSNADLTRFAEVSAHHLMEPTRRLISYSQRLRKLLSSSLPPEQEINANFDYLQHDANRLHAMLHDIQLYLAAAEPRGLVQLEDVNSVLMQIQKRFLLRLNALKVTVIAENLPPVYLDRPRLLDLFSLIIDNALRHGLPEKADLPAQIVITGERIGKLSYYAISDNGPGISAEYHERVFEIFERLGHNAEAGSGIGLAIVRRIVENRHGHCWIENQPQPGTTVIFELPDGE
jgi:PAS domain S-box-containing protein